MEGVGIFSNIGVYNETRHNFFTYMNTQKQRDSNIHEFQHPSLNSRYGIELEFFSSENRYVIANRINSCMFNNNDLWWRNNFNAKFDINSNFPFSNGQRHLDTGSNFNEFSSFFVESALVYRTPSHRGEAICSNQGTAGLRIENDSSVEMSNNGPGITAWSINVRNRHENTDIKGVGGTYNPNYKGLSSNVVNFSFPKNFPFSQHTLKGNNEWNINSNSTFITKQQNELVTNVLTNDYIKYPLGIESQEREGEGEGEIPTKEKYLPLGALLMDNFLNHLLSHQTVLFTQRCGFHVHLSEFSKIKDEGRRKQFIVGFVKLFYVFEPLLYSFHPIYRSRSDYAQSLQSIFTRDEIRDGTEDQIWNDLAGIEYEDYMPISGVPRKRGQRYVALNLMNCRGGIGTMEVRIGHVTFDTQFIQTYVNILQTLLKFNEYAINTYIRLGKYPFTIHNSLLNIDGLIPYYCTKLSSDDYNEQEPRESPQDNNLHRSNTNNYKINRGFMNFNKFRPTHGFFDSCGYDPGDKEYKTSIISNQIKTFIFLTGSFAQLRLMTPYINYYHATEDTSELKCWLNGHHMNNIDFDNLNSERYSTVFQGTAPTEEQKNKEFINNFKPVLKDIHYIPGSKYFNPECPTCEEPRKCKPKYNNGKNFTKDEIISSPRIINGNRDDRKNQAHLYRVDCSGSRYYSKVQTELINYKIYDDLRGVAPQSQVAVASGPGQILNFTQASTQASHRPFPTISQLSQPSLRGVPLASGHTSMFGPSRVYSLGGMGGGKTRTRRYKVKGVRKTRKMIGAGNENTNEDSRPAENEPYVNTSFYRVNEGAESISIRKNGTKVEAGYVNWVGEFMEDKGLTTIFNRLLDEKIISETTLDLLLENRYMDYYVFLKEEDYHKNKLKEELAKFNITNDTIEKIRKVYVEFDKSRQQNKSSLSSTITTQTSTSTNTNNKKNTKTSGLEFVTTIKSNTNTRNKKNTNKNKKNKSFLTRDNKNINLVRQNLNKAESVIV